jgi:hypothetical protein
VIVTAVLMAGAAEARAQKSSLMGQGSLTCGTWTAWRRDGLALGPQQWVLGFLSGIGVMGESDLNPLNDVDADSVFGWIDSYCQAHPSEKVMRAAAAFIGEHPR